MNTIQITYGTSKYSTERHLIIQVDEIPLDQHLHETYPQYEINGLVPTLLHWLNMPGERTVVWNRIESKEKQIVPILMCPDDRDLWCTIINVEIEKTEHSVKWLRLGIDSGEPDGMPNSIGTKVDWFDKIPVMEFDLAEYEKVISTFRTEIEKQKKLNTNFVSESLHTKEQNEPKNRHVLKPVKPSPNFWSKLKKKLTL